MMTKVCTMWRQNSIFKMAGGKFGSSKEASPTISIVLMCDWMLSRPEYHGYIMLRRTFDTPTIENGQKRSPLTFVNFGLCMRSVHTGNKVEFDTFFCVVGSDVNPCPCKSSPCPCPGPCRLGPCPCPCRSSPWQALFLNLACNTHSIVLIVIYLFSVMGFTVICCELPLCVNFCCLIAIVGLAATCSK